MNLLLDKRKIFFIFIFLSLIFYYFIFYYIIFYNYDSITSFTENKVFKKGIICYLVPPFKEDISDLKQSLKTLEENYIFKVPILILHENFNDSLLKEIETWTSFPIIFENVIRFFGKYNNHIPNVNCIFPLGYRNMCNFYSYHIFHLPVLKDYDYLWRMDTDSFLYRNMTKDIFEEMYMNHSSLGFGYVGTDSPSCLVGFREWIQKNYLKNSTFNNFSFGSFLFPKKKPPQNNIVYNTNAIVFDLNFFRSNIYQEYFKKIEDTKGIYENRWGDHAIITTFVNLYINQSNPICLSEKIFPIIHQGRKTNCDSGIIDTTFPYHEI